MIDDPDGRLDKARFRSLMSQWATGVSLVTCLSEDGPVGCTVNALTSLSLEPPELLVCLDLTARTLEHLRGVRRFAINMLSADQAELCARFASRTSTQAEKFDGTPVLERHGTILLEGCIATVVCDVVEELIHGDHAIIIAEAVQGEAREGAPLIFYRSALATLET